MSGVKALNIIVMIKQVPDPSRNLRTTAEGAIDREKTPAVMNRNCKHAVEEALKLKERHGGQVTAISMGPPKAAEALREAIAMGCDRAVLLTDRKLAGSDTWATAYALSQAALRVSREFGKTHLYLTGMQTTDGDTAHVGPQLAERLGIPVVAYCERLEMAKGGSMMVRRILEGGYEMLRVKKLPVVLTITALANEPREPTLYGLIRGKRAEIIAWGVADAAIDENLIGLRFSPTVVAQVRKVEYTRPPCQMIKGVAPDAVGELFRRLSADGKSEVM